MPKLNPRTAKSRDLSIVGDEQERHRIQLEHNLQLNNDLSLHLSFSKEDYSIEYPRHADHQSSYPAFPSFHHHSVENLDPEDQSHVHHWSYRSLDDDDDNAVNPYAAGSLSTAAHHASALTFTAGLGGHRRDQTQSGVEYDPDRPLHNMIAGVDSKLSMFGNTQSKSHNLTSEPLIFDPLVVDDSAQLDRVLNTGRAPSHISPTQLRSPLASSSSSSSSSVSSPNSPRPKLSDALHHAAFSPKRPRSAQALVSPRAARNLPPRVPSPSPGNVGFDDVPTPRARSKTTLQPQFNVHPPTPSSVTSKFTKVARGLARDIEMEQNRIRRADDQDGIAAHSTVRDKPRTKGRRGVVKPTPKARIYLPDVTGLTNAIESPARVRLDYHRYDAYDDRECDARILATLSIVQSKLAFLESENSISRRRVRELELELEACKKEVARERTRVLAMEMEDVERQHAATMKAHAERKGKAKATGYEEPSRYREAVEEKKALEALISTLRSHLSRLTSELSSHQVLLNELRSLRDADARALQTKSEEVDHLREQVERLAGEVEVLKGVVEEGLKERRMVREQSSLSHDVGEGSEAEGHQSEIGQASEEEMLKVAGDDKSLFDTDIPPSRTPPRATTLGGTIRTDHATAGSSKMGGQGIKPFISSEEVERISFELNGRRSIRSASPSVASSVSSHTQSLSYAQPRIDSHPQSPSPQASMLRGSTSPRQGNQTIRRSPSPEIMTQPEHAARPSAPTPGHALNHGQTSRNPKNRADKELESPFPQIRGERLERLFFSAPEHNTYTCAVCQRRHRHGGQKQTQSWLPTRFRTNAREPSDDDEGFAEGDEHLFTDVKGKGRATVHFADLQQNRDRKLPPQTVLSRVLRELEDDFTHYKGIYVELSDQYKLMDAISNVAKRNVLAEHLRDVIDILEQRGDQIASLYDLLTFEDKVVPTRMQQGQGSTVA